MIHPTKPTPSWILSLPRSTGESSRSTLDSEKGKQSGRAVRENGQVVQAIPTPMPTSGSEGEQRKQKKKRAHNSRPNPDDSSSHPNRSSYRLNPKAKRQGASSGPTFDNYPSCDNVGNTLLSCYPQSNTTLVQSVWSRFIWNANYPTFIERGEVDVHLFQADSGEQVTEWQGVTNSQGSVTIRPDETWWSDQDRASQIQQGNNETYSFYFVVVPSGQSLNGGEPHQNTFEAVQTSPPSSILASISSASVASASSASVAAAITSASLSSVSLASLSSLSTGTRESTDQGGRRTDGTLQNDGSDDGGFPKWAIAVIVVLGVLLIITTIAVWCFMLALARKRKRREAEEASYQETTDHGGEMSKDGIFLGPAMPAAEKSREMEKEHRGMDEKHPLVEDMGASPTSPTSAGILASPLTSASNRDDSSSIATARPHSRFTYQQGALRPGLVPVNRKQSAASGIGSQASGIGLIGQSSGLGADQSSIASSGPISPGEAEDLAVAFRQAMRKAGDEPLTEDESPDAETPPASALMRRELQQEGVGIQPLGDRKSYHIQGADG